MKRAALLILALIFFMLPLSAFSETYSTGDLLLVENAYTAPLYASFHPNDATVITYIPSGSVVMYIAAVDKGFCVAYENFVGYMDEYYLKKVYSVRYDFSLPNGDAIKDLLNHSENDAAPGYNEISSVVYFPYHPVSIFPNQNISTRTGPGTKYTEPGTFSGNKDYTVYYQTSGSGVNWGYVEFLSGNQLIRAYTGVKRFSASGYVPYDEETWIYKDIFSSFSTRYGPGYEYMEAPFEKTTYGSRVKAYFTENGWTMIEYELSNGYLHRGWVPNWCLE